MREELPGPKLTPARHLRGDPDVLRHVDPGDAVGRRPIENARAAGEIVVGDSGQVELAPHRDAAPDRQARVHLDELQLAVARIADKLDMGEALVPDVPEQLQPLLLDLRLTPGLEDRARSEAERPLANLPAGDAGERLSLPADVGQQRI